MSEEKLLDDFEKLLGEDESSRSKINFSTIFSLFVLNWPYFLLSFFIFVSGAGLYLRYTDPTFKVSARVLIKDEGNGRARNASQMLTNMVDMGVMSRSTGIENEIEVLKSRLLIRDVVRDLNLYSECRRKGRVRDMIFYGRLQPVFVELDSLHLDSLDREYIEGGMATSMMLKFYQKDGTNMVEGALQQPDIQDGKARLIFSKKLTSFPAQIETPVGTLTLTASPRAALDPKETYYVTLLPPVVVATKMLGLMTVDQLSTETNIAVVSLAEKNIMRGMDFLRQLVVCYNRQANDDKNEIARRTEEFINERVLQINKELGSTEEEIESFKRENAATGLSVDGLQATVQMTNQYSTRLSEANAQIQMLDYLSEFVNDPKNRYQIIPSNVGLTDGASTQLISSYNKTVQDRNRLLVSLSEDAPQVQSLTTTLQNLEASIKTALTQARRSADIAREGVMTEFGRYHGQLYKAPVQERVLNQIGRQLNVKSGIYLLLLQKREENSIAMAATADKGKLIDEPLYEGKVRPKKMFVLFIAAFFAFAIPFAIIWILSLFRYKIEGHKDVEEMTDLPIIADVAVANEKVKNAAGIVVHENMNTQMDEVFRSLRTNLLFLLKEGQKTILFTSCTSGEGKTFCAANLATSFALLGKKVVLCGMDIRKPALRRLFSIEDRSQGLTMLLTKNQVTKEDLEEQLINSGINKNLDLLMAGPTPPNPTELLARDSFQQVLNLLKENYDYIILDTAPIGLISDTVQIAAYADVNVYVCRADYTPKSSFSLLRNLTKEGKLRNACVVVNGIDMSRRKYGYYYGYGNYGNYGLYGGYTENPYSQKDDKSIKK